MIVVSKGVSRTSHFREMSDLWPSPLGPFIVHLGERNRRHNGPNMARKRKKSRGVSAVLRGVGGALCGEKRFHMQTGLGGDIHVWPAHGAGQAGAAAAIQAIGAGRRRDVRDACRHVVGAGRHPAMGLVIFHLSLSSWRSAHRRRRHGARSRKSAAWFHRPVMLVEAVRLSTNGP